jgi:hypothetical protein
VAISHSFITLSLLTLAVAMPAHARVGVTSETNGDPIGKPPAEVERLLRVGIDIQADELITTKADDRAHVVFLDGTSLTVAPNAQLKIDKFVYDPDSKKGDIAISVTTGVFRVVGGKISKSKPIVVNTPSATIGLRGGIGLFAVDRQETKAQFLFGVAMTVTAMGRTETAQRAGSEILTKSGAFPGAPGMIPIGGVTQSLTALEGHIAGGNDKAPDERARRSGFSEANSGQGTGRPTGSTQIFRTDNAVEAVSNATLQQGRSIHTNPPIVTASAPPPPTIPVVVPSPPVTPTPPVYVNHDFDCRDDRFHFDRSFHFPGNRR